MLIRQCVYVLNSSRNLSLKTLIYEQRINEVCQCLNRINRPFRFLSRTSGFRVTDTENHNNSNEQNLKVNNIENKSQRNRTFFKTSTSTENAVSSEELLEKMIAGLSTDIHQKNRVYKNDFLRVINKIKDLNFSTKKQGLLLLHCCTELLPDETPLTRMNLAEQLWNTIRPHTKFTTDHYNELLRCYVANNKSVTVRSFIQQMEPMKPNATTYDLFLQNLCQSGDLDQAAEVLSNMKAQGLPATENIFSSLIIGHGKTGNIKYIQEILSMMKSLKIEQSIETYTAICKALAWKKDDYGLIEQMQKVQKKNMQFEETHIMDIVKTLAAVENYAIIAQVLKFLPIETLKSPSISPHMQSVATLLVFQNHPIAALEIYKCLPLPSFGPKDDKGLHGRSLVRDCVKASLPSSVIGHITQELMSSGRNPIALHNATEAALQQGKIPLAIDLFTRMQQLGLPLRTHYFWPVLIHSSKMYGERGIINTISTMIAMDVRPDYDTIVDYVLPYVSFTSPQNLIKKFLESGLTVSIVLTPMMEILLSTGQVRAASELCELYEGKLEVEKLIKPLIKGYLMSSDLKSTIHILEDISKKAREKDKDWVGKFFCDFMKHRSVMQDTMAFTNLVQALKDTKLRISGTALELCLTRIPDILNDEIKERIKNDLVEITDERLVDESELFVTQILHPKKMPEPQLRAHLTELEAKGMNTRGVLRQLLQQYCREGDMVAAKEVVAKCQSEGVFLSAGMRASIFDMHVKLGELNLAEESFTELTKTSPNFTLDEFKILDFATLMVQNGKIDQALHIVTEQAKKRRIMGGRSIETNCRRLLDAVAAQGSPKDAADMFQKLTSFGYCKPTNIILGPLIRVHLKNDNIQNAVNEFVKLGEKFRKTPLKHELLCKIIKTQSTDESFVLKEKTFLNKMIQTVLNIDKKVHGAGDVQLTLIAALAEVGYKKTLRKVFLDPTVKFNPDTLMQKCERFADERKVSVIENIAECTKDLRHVDTEGLYNLMLDVYQRDDDCQKALSLWYKMQELDVVPSQKFVQNICSMLKANNKNIPPEMFSLLDKQSKSKILN